MARWIIYSVRNKGAGTFKLEMGPIKATDNPDLAALWRGGKLLAVQSNELKARRMCRLIEMQATLNGYSIESVP